MDNPFRGISTIHILCCFSMMVEHLPRLIQRRLFAAPFRVLRFGLFRSPISVSAENWPINSETGGRNHPKWVAGFARNTQFTEYCAFRQESATCFGVFG
jgi:hypothetical protein